MKSKKISSFLSYAQPVLLGVICFPITCFVICTGDFPPCGNGRMQAAKQKEIAKAYKKKIKDQPKPLEERRKRELSLEPTERRRNLTNVFSIWKRDRKTPARLLQLPPEILEKILLEVLGGNTFHLIQCRRRLGHIRCKEPHNIDHVTNSEYDIARACIPHAQRRKYTAFEYMYCNDQSSSFYTRSDSCLAILLTCRQLYNQGIPILYSCNTFDVNNPETLLHLSQTIILSRLKSIRSLQIDVNTSMTLCTQDWGLAGSIVECPEWKMFLGILERLEGLQNLRFRAEFDLLQDIPGGPYSDELFLRPLEEMLEAIKLSSLRGLRRFDLETNISDAEGIGQIVENVRGVVCT
ncbi:hypothetical protein BHYA_0109g00200 [Botrytis hyacinthi]|uniref:DUF7730 domain-containing protein n=1 Tax=Botrytis hyacinthi TaxID=278943 RepID=A0A4Z1GJ54_9HELO|nr:hypothetical protein BHYA_0109g00200 [Botrytis hyacinthi]